MKTIIFDIDGVLVDSEPHHVEIEKILFAKLNIEISDEEHNSYMGKATDRVWQEIIRNKNLDYNSEDLVALTVNASKIHFAAQKDLLPMTGLVDGLEKYFIKGVPIAVSSSSGQEIIDIILEIAVLKKFFFHTVSSDLVGGSKPEPSIFIHTAKSLSAKPEECIVIEDSINGISAAKAANMFCIAYTGASTGQQSIDLADQQINHCSELGAIIDQYIQYQ